MYLEVFFQFVGGLGMFLYGMDNMSSGMQKIAGPKLKKILATITSNTLMAVLVGLIITGLVQSSSVSTVMAIGFINASLLTLKQGLGIILGANIGTTITGWILAMNIGKYGLPIVGASASVYIFSKKDKVKTIALTVMGFGFIFLGLEIMSNGLKPLRSLPEFVEMFQMFSADSYFGVIKAALVGTLLTAVVQSSSATLGITIALATQGLIDFPTAVALVLGENVGTTITAFLASLGASTNARRAAYAHTIINVTGVIWVTSIFPYYLDFLNTIVDSKANIGVAIATAHTIFNVLNVLIFVPLISYFDKFLHYIVKDTDQEKQERVTHLHKLMLKLPNLVIDQTKTEILTMGAYIKDMFFKLEEVYYDDKKIEEYLDDILKTEDKLDLYEKEIYEINFSILNQDIHKDLVETTRTNLLVCDEYETISDYLGRVANVLNRLKNNEIVLDKEKMDIIIELNSQILDLFININIAFRKFSEKENLFVDYITTYKKIRNKCKDYRNEYFLEDNEHNLPMANTSYLDILNYYRRAIDHMYNIIECFVKL